MAASPIIAPEEELELEKKDFKVCETKQKPAGQRQPDRSLLAKIFEGHEEFLGLAPD